MTISTLLAMNAKVNGAYEWACQPVLRETGLPKTSFDIIMFLANNPEFYTARDICIMKNLRANVVSLHVDRLVREGYLQRLPVDRDRRKIRLLCTEKAEAVIRMGHAVQQRFFEELTRGLSRENREIIRSGLELIGRNAEHMQKR